MALTLTFTHCVSVIEANGVEARRKGIEETETGKGAPR